jgi:Tol biopolymer transport system component
LATSDLGSPAQIELLSTGPGQPRRLTNDGMAHFVVGWAPDGSDLVTGAGEPNGPIRSYWMDLNGKSRAVAPAPLPWWSL